MMLKFLLLFLCTFAPLGHSESETYRQLRLFSEVFRYVRSQSVKPISDEALIEYAIQGMLNGVDGYSSYISPDKYQEVLNNLKGEFGGIGIEFASVDGKIVILSPVDDSPAVQAGLAAGDELLEIDGQPVVGLSLSEIRDKIKGQLNEPLSLKIRRKDVLLSFELRRSKIILKPVKSSFSKGILFLRISHFSKNVGQSVRTLLKSHSQGLKGIILDLRNNPGGILEEALDITNIFLSTEKIVSIKTRNPKNDQIYYAHPQKCLLPRIPLLVLVNKGTASSAEIVAAALKDHKRAILIGETTFGKGSVQTILPIPPGYSAIQLTTGLYYTPSGTSLDKRGILSHVHCQDDVSFSQNRDAIRERAEKSMSSEFYFKPASGSSRKGTKQPSRPKTSPPKKPGPAKK
ncbi:MAG: S41 family peptidase [Alphaproteobacteria bacterium]